MRVMVTGGAGFIGSHLCDAILAEGHTVICVDNLSLGIKKNIAHIFDNENFRFYEADVSVPEKLNIIVKKEKPEYVFHLAANSDIKASAKDPEVEFKNTYSTTFHILNVMRSNGVHKLFFASTSAVYGDNREIALKENTTKLEPISYYGAAKLGSEALIQAFSYMNDMEVLVFRFPNVIGPRLTHGVIYDFISKLEHDSSKLQILGDGKQKKPYIYIDDLLKAIIYFMDKESKGVELYNVGVLGETSVTQIADILCEEMNLTNVKYNYTGGEAGWKGDVPKFLYCLDKIHEAGWSAKYTSNEAVRLTIQRVLQERE